MRNSLLMVLVLVCVLAGGWQLYFHHPGPDRPSSVSTSGSASTSATREAMSAIAKARATLIEQKTAELVGIPRTVELTSEKAEKARQAINAGDFDTAGNISSEVLAHSHLQGWSFYPFNVFIGGLIDLASPQYESRLSAWYAKEPNNAMPLVIRAAYYKAAAWRARGAHFASKTQSAHIRAFSTQLAKAQQDVVAALALDQNNPWPYYLHLSILAGHGESEEIEHAFQEAIVRYPDYYPLYTERMGTLQPKWGGSVPLLVDFVDTHAGGARADSPLKLLYLEL